ncbi:MAG: hypothetical protein KDH96_04100 [Candidatus Riesia sp.]|nr:hypothetical protein [Candidatus Riesia sp.]
MFADTMMEDEDLYRFVDEAALDVGGSLVKIADGRTPWEVYDDVSFLGNSRIDPCSKILKRDLIRSYLKENHDPESTVIYLGIDWSEQHRFEKAKKYWDPWKVKAPLCEKPHLEKIQMFKLLSLRGIEIPRLYKLGFPHNNCGGFCCKAGIGQFKLLLDKMPDRFKFHEAKEQEFRHKTGRDVAILRSQSKESHGVPIPLTQLRSMTLSREDELDLGGCGCFSDYSEEEPSDSSSWELLEKEAAAAVGSHLEYTSEFKKSLSNLEVSILEMYLKAKSYSQIASKLNRKVKTIDNAMQRIRKKFKQYKKENSSKNGKR